MHIEPFILVAKQALMVRNFHHFPIFVFWKDNRPTVSSFIVCRISEPACYLCWDVFVR